MLSFLPFRLTFHWIIQQTMPIHFVTIPWLAPNQREMMPPKIWILDSLKISHVENFGFKIQLNCPQSKIAKILWSHENAFTKRSSFSKSAAQMTLDRLFSTACGASFHSDLLGLWKSPMVHWIPSTVRVGSLQSRNETVLWWMNSRSCNCSIEIDWKKGRKTRTNEKKEKKK